MLLGLTAAALITMSQADAVEEREVAITGREIVERLARLEEGQKRLEVQLTQRIDDLRQLVLWGFGITFAGISSLVGFVIWDRRTGLHRLSPHHSLFSPNLYLW